MVYELFLDASNRIIGMQNTAIVYHGGVTVDVLPSGNINDYLFVNGQYVYDPLPVPPEPIPEPSADDILNALLGVEE